ncbi:MAG: hypothetical protein QM610_02575 [Chitinophagaceae bacterium]
MMTTIYLVLAILLLAKLINYVALGSFRVKKFIVSFRKIYLLKYYYNEPIRMRQYRMVSNILNILIYATLLTIIIFLLLKVH